MYDPLRHRYLTAAEPPAASYWQATAETPAIGRPLVASLDTEVAIIGAGNTGLSTAWHLAAEHGVPAVILEANTACFGASGRNAGFLLPGSGRLSWPAMIRRFGLSATRQIFTEYQQAVENAQHLAALADDRCDLVSDGYLRIAHSEKSLQQLQATADCLKTHFGYRGSLLAAKQLTERLPGFQQSFGGLFQACGVGVNPLKLSQALARQALAAGCELYTRTPVTAWQHKAGWHLLQTPRGLVRARKLVLATNGYTADPLFPILRGRYLPVLSSIIVTRPLTESEMAATGLTDGCVMMDTRALKYYYRKLPDNRLLFGGRGALSGRHDTDPKVAKRLLQGLRQTFPALDTIGYDYFWSGWISISWDDIPHVCQADGNSGIYYSTGYCGSGQAFAIQAGKRLADAVANNRQVQLSALNHPLPRFPLAPFRRLGQALFYQTGRLLE